eukprot:TRINITY_DN5766_c0_g1_i1.p1 TRINITY_DN5766_c0_g1~~TRINITY_DN5766_c0_g1_i1.p1  ORF type:complete len:1384 (+),score=409.57 TRINITY_DN5766_c0_g1_i1:189-4340(+)
MAARSQSVRGDMFILFSGFKKNNANKFLARSIHLDFRTQIFQTFDKEKVKKYFPFQDLNSVEKDAANPFGVKIIYRKTKAYHFLTQTLPERELLCAHLQRIISSVSQSQTAPSGAPGPIKRGPADKEGSVKWERRDLALYDQTLYVFRDASSERPINAIPLVGTPIVCDSSTIIRLLGVERTFGFRFTDSRDRDEWFEKLLAASHAATGSAADPMLHSELAAALTSKQALTLDLAQAYARIKALEDQLGGAAPADTASSAADLNAAHEMVTKLNKQVDMLQQALSEQSRDSTTRLERSTTAAPIKSDNSSDMSGVVSMLRLQLDTSQQQLHISQQQVQTFQQQLEHCQQQLTFANGQVQQLRDQLHQLQEQAKSQVISAAELQTIQAAQAALVHYDQDRAEWIARQKELTDQLQLAQERIAHLEGRQQQQIVDAQSGSLDASALQQLVAQMQTDSSQRSAEMAALRASSARLQEMLEVSKAENLSLITHASSGTAPSADSTTLQQMLMSLQSETVQRAIEVTSLKASNERLTEMMKQAHTENTALAQRLATYKAEHKGTAATAAGGDSDALQQVIQQLRSDNASRIAEAEKLQESIQHLTELLDKARADNVALVQQFAAGVSDDAASAAVQQMRDLLQQLQSDSAQRAADAVVAAAARADRSAEHSDSEYTTSRAEHREMDELRNECIRLQTALQSIEARKPDQPLKELDERVAQWLVQIDKDRYKDSFMRNEVTWSDLPHLTEDNLAEMGIALVGPRRRITAEIRKLQPQELSAAELVPKLHEELETAHTDMDSMVEEVAQLHQSVRTAEAKVSELRQQLETATTEASLTQKRLTSELDAAQDKIVSLQKQAADTTRLEAVEKQVATLKDELKEAISEKDEITQAYLKSEADLRQIESERDALARRAQEMQGIIDRNTGDAAAERDQLKQRVAELQVSQKLASVVRQRVGTMSTAVKTVRSTTTSLRALLSENMALSIKETATVKDAIGKLTKIVMVDVNKAVARYEYEATLRRKLQSKLVAAGGNIRVYCRIRPPGSGDADERMAYDLISDVELSLQMEAGHKKNFEFDAVFGPAVDQSTIYNECLPLIECALEGFNVCVFAYGQTGSGKTHTMQGPEDNPGVSIRALRTIFDEVARRDDRMQYTVAVSIMEIYNEAINDLLVSPDEDANKKHEVKVTAGGVLVTEMTERVVTSLAETLRLAEIGRGNRAVASTKMNADSSRSHSVMMIRLLGEDRITQTKVVGKLTMVDLAGSERIKKSGATGQQLVEAKNINQSLSALGNVIQALAAHQSHVPFRDSKLTYLLSDSLGGNSKTLMFVNVAPTMRDITETACSLTFAQRVNKVEMGPARKGGDREAEMEVLRQQVMKAKVIAAIGSRGKH